MEMLYLIFYACLRFRFLDVDVETNPVLRRPVPDVYRIVCSNGRGLAGNLSDLTVALALYDIPLFFNILVPDMRCLSELLVPGFGRLDLLYRGKMDTEHFANQNFSVVIAK